MPRRRSTLLVSLLVGLGVGLVIWRAVPSSGDEAKSFDPEAENHAAKLDAPVPMLALKDATFEQAIDRLRELTHANIIVDWPVMIGFDRGRQLSLTLGGDVDLAHAINVLLVMYGDQEPRITCTAHDGLVYVGPIDQRRGVTCVFDARDFQERFVGPNSPPVEAPADPSEMLFSSRGPQPKSAPRGIKDSPPPEGVAPSASLVALQSALGQRLSERFSHMTRLECIDMLVRLIEETVDADSWRDNGGQLGSIREMDGLLLIENSPEAQVKVGRVLNNLRKIRARIDRHEAPTTQPMDLLAP